MVASAPEARPERLDERVADAVLLHGMNDGPHVLDSCANDAVRGAQARFDRLKVRPAGPVRRTRHPHPGVHGTLGSLGPPGLPPTLRGGFALLDRAPHRPALGVRDLE